MKDYAVREVLEEQYGQDYTAAISGDVLVNDGVTITNTRNTVSHTVTKVGRIITINYLYVKVLKFS